MNTLQSDFSNAIDWQFLNEPLYKWAIFIAVLLAILFLYQGMLKFFMDE